MRATARARSAVQRLLEEPHRHGFFQALRLLERWFARCGGGGTEDVLARRVRIHNTLAMSFPASEIAALEVVRRAGDGPAGPPPDATAGEADADADAESIDHVDITPAFFSLLGAGGTLPAFYTELFAERETYHRDTAGRAFLDVFLQRSTVLLYRAWLKHRLPLQFEADRRNRSLPMVLALAGLGQEGLRERLRAQDGGVADDSVAHFAGLVQQRPRSAAAVQAVVQRYFGVPVKLTEFVGRWFALPAEHQSRLGLGHGTLGTDAMVGERVWQRDLCVRLEIGPMDRRRFARFLPGGPTALALRELITLLTGVTLEFEVRLVLRAADVHGACLSDAAGPRLGWDSFLVTEAARQDRSDAGYSIHAAA